MSGHPHPEPPEPARRERRLAVVDAPAESATPTPTVRPGRGRLLAVSGLCGGAGASTVSLLIARYALQQQRGPVLVADTGGPAGGLAAYAHTEAPRSLTELAELVEGGLPAGQPFATAKDGLRVLATGPRLPHDDGCPADGVATVLEHARVAHPLTVVDCGTLATASDQIALRAASHVAWVLPATRSGVARAARVLEAVNPHLLGRQLVVARRDHADSKAPMRDLKALAQRCGGPLIFIPHLPDLHHGKPAEALDAAQIGLQAILGALTR